MYILLFIFILLQLTNFFYRQESVQTLKKEKNGLGNKTSKNSKSMFTIKIN